MTAKLLVIIGPTASGKTDLAYSIARKYGGELISADSRQIYSGMDIGTGKDLSDDASYIIVEPSIKIKKDRYQYGYYLIRGTKVWLLDLARPDQEFSPSHFYLLANRAVKEILSRGKLPIAVGGSGFYINSLLNPPMTIDVPPDEEIRKKLNKKPVSNLKQLLMKADPDKYLSMNNSDVNNPRRLVRAIEIAEYLKNNPPGKMKNHIPEYDTLVIGLKVSKHSLTQRIRARILKRKEAGQLDEIKSLLHKGYSWDALGMNALGYREFREYFSGKRDLDTSLKEWEKNEIRYAKRQMTYFRKMRNIFWFYADKEEYHMQIDEVIRKWYTSVSSKYSENKKNP